MIMLKKQTGLVSFLDNPLPTHFVQNILLGISNTKIKLLFLTSYGSDGPEMLSFMIVGISECSRLFK